MLLYIGLGLIFSTIYLILIKRENKKRDAGLRDEVIRDVNAEVTTDGDEKNGTYDTVADAKREKGDTWSGYRYTE